MKKRTKTLMVTLSLRIPRQLHQGIANADVREGMSIAEWTRSLWAERLRAFRQNSKPSAHPA